MCTTVCAMCTTVCAMCTTVCNVHNCVCNVHNCVHTYSEGRNCSAVLVFLINCSSLRWSMIYDLSIITSHLWHACVTVYVYCFSDSVWCLNCDFILMWYLSCSCLHWPIISHGGITMMSRMLRGMCSHFYCVTHMHSADYAVARCLSVCHTLILCVNSYTYPQCFFTIG